VKRNLTSTSVGDQQRQATNTTANRHTRPITKRAGQQKGVLMFYCLSVMLPVEEGRDLSMRLPSKFILAVAVLLTLVVSDLAVSSGF